MECDAVVRMRNGDYGLVEVRLGGKNLIEEGAATLNGLASIIDKYGDGITGGEAYGPLCAMREGLVIMFQ